jgi:type IV pilus assembly protein PilQ
MKSGLFNLLFFFILSSAVAQVQQENRFQVLAQRLNDLSLNVPGLNQKASLNVANGSLSEFIRALANTHQLNVNIGPNINQKITNYFSGETVRNILLYLAQTYNLDFTFTGSIITINNYNDPLANLPPPRREIHIEYNNTNSTISMDLREDTLLNVARKITMLTNKNVVVMPEIFHKTVNGFIQSLPVDNALEKLALTNNFKFNKTNDDVFVLSPLANDEKIVLKPTLGTMPNPNTMIRRTSNQQPGSSESVQVMPNDNGKKMISLNVVNMPIREIIKNISEQAGINYFIYSEIQGNTTANVSNMEFDRVMSYILQGTEYTYREEGGIYLIGLRQNEGLRSYKMVQLQYRSVDSLMHIIPPELSKGVEIKEFKELNSFLLSGSSPQINEIERFVKQVDWIVPMITLEVILLDIRKGKSVSTGIKMGVSDSVKTGGTLLNGLNFTMGARSVNDFIDRIGINNVFNLGHVTPNFYVQLSALESNENIELRQTPKLSTLNGHVANLSIGSTRYYSISTQNVLGSLNTQTVVTQQYQPVEANLSIDVMPIVSGDEQVTMNIDVKISDFIGDPPNNAPPPTSNSKFRSIVRVKNEEMVVLGGIERNEKSESGSGIPFLSRIPVLKWIFSSKTRSTHKVVSVVFIKPTIVY